MYHHDYWPVYPYDILITCLVPYEEPLFTTEAGTEEEAQQAWAPHVMAKTFGKWWPS